MMKSIEIGRLLRAGSSGCVIGCKTARLEDLSFGGMVLIPAAAGLQIYGLITAIHIDDDGLVRQLVTAENVSPDIIDDNRLNRSAPVELEVLFIGYEEQGQVYHLLPPRPPLSLDAIYLCPPAEVRRFTTAGSYGWFRHILRAVDQPVGEIVAAHLQQAERAHAEAGAPNWVADATRELITLLRDDYPTLMSVLAALRDARLAYPQEAAL
jgi:hypothetical protein